jgi:hypothetical protein
MNNDLDGFQERVLDKHYFDYQLKRCLCIYLTPEELDAVFLSIDSDRSGFIDGVEFLRYFFRLGMEARNGIRLQVIASTTEIETKKRREEFEERKMFVSFFLSSTDPLSVSLSLSLSPSLCLSLFLSLSLSGCTRRICDSRQSSQRSTESQR